jgi:hypothetical protein
MDAEKRQVLEAAGWRFGDAADFLVKSGEIGDTLKSVTLYAKQGR